jgi:hypothetical protein
LATGVGFIFEVKAGKEFEILNKVKDERPVKVIRRQGGNKIPNVMMIQRQDVVIGDVVKLESGDEIPADGVLLESTSLRVDESNFTGELYANKSADKADFDDDATYPSDFLLRGSTVIEGNGVFKVTAIGMDTEEGKGVARTHEGSDVETPLNRQLAQLGKAQDQQRRTNDHGSAAVESLAKESIPAMIRSPNYRNRTAAKHSLLHQPANITRLILMEAKQNPLLLVDKIAQMLHQVFDCIFLFIRLSGMINQFPIDFAVHLQHLPILFFTIIHNIPPKKQ